MKKIASIFVIMFLIVSIGIIISALKDDFEKKGKTIEYIQKGEAIRVLDTDEEVLFEYSIEEFREWAKENWEEVFEVPPAFGEVREVDPESFYRFDNTASLSPCFKFLAFSVNDYAVATNISFIGVINLENEEVSLVGAKNTGGVQNLYWSPNGNYIAYILDTARAQGDYFTVDNMEKMEKEFTFSGKEILTEKEEDEIRTDFMPRFRTISWTEEERIGFVADDYNDDNEEVGWSVSPQGTDLRKTEIKEEE